MSLMRQHSRLPVPSHSQEGCLRSQMWEWSYLSPEYVSRSELSIFNEISTDESWRWIELIDTYTLGFFFSSDVLLRHFRHIYRCRCDVVWRTSVWPPCMDVTAEESSQSSIQLWFLSALMIHLHEGVWGFVFWVEPWRATWSPDHPSERSLHVTDRSN